MTFKFPGMDRFSARGKGQEKPKVPDDMRAGLDKATNAFARLSRGKKIPPMPTGRPLSDTERKAVASVVEELTGRKPKGRVNDPEVNQRLHRLFGGGQPTPVGEAPAPPERPPVYRQGGGVRQPPRL